MSILPVAPAPGYSSVSKWLHWGIFFLMAAQFFIVYSIEELDDDRFSEDRLFLLHIGFGLAILVLGVVRIWWRRSRQLPAWAPTLSGFERRFAHQVERALYVLMIGIPLSGLGLAITDERRLPFFGRRELFEDAEDFFELAHIGSHVLFFLFFALHVGLVLKHQLVDRDRLLNRML